MIPDYQYRTPHSKHGLLFWGIVFTVAALGILIIYGLSS